MSNSGDENIQFYLFPRCGWITDEGVQSLGRSLEKLKNLDSISLDFTEFAIAEINKRLIICS